MKRPFIALLFALSIFAFGSVRADHPSFAGNTFSSKTMKPKAEMPAGCFYFTVTSPLLEKPGSRFSRPSLHFTIFNTSKQPRYSPAEYYFHFWNGDDAEFQENGNYGQLVETCVVPGTYVISVPRFESGICDSFCLMSGDPAAQPFEFDVGEGQAVYVGNFHASYGKSLRDGRVVFRNLFDRDKPFVESVGKSPMKSQLVNIEVRTWQPD